MGKLNTSKIEYSTPGDPVEFDKKESNRDFYLSKEWRKFREANLLTFCEVAEEVGDLVYANTLDHAIRITIEGAKFDRRNMISMCRRAHDIKRALESNGQLEPTMFDYLDTKYGKVPTQEYRKKIINLVAQYYANNKP